jgi:acetyl-CoA carboxylase biotin carboxyl carrier protein
MNQKELKELIDFLIDRNISEFELERGDVKVRVRRGSDAHVSVAGQPVHVVPVAATPVVVPAANAASPPAATPPAVEEVQPAPEEALHIVKSPIVGTFYEAPGPGAGPFVKPGDQVQAGQVLCIIEAMKLMNEIESDVAGEVVKRLAANGQPVEYGQPLFSIRTKK